MSELQDVKVGDEEDLKHFAPHFQSIVRAMNGDAVEAEAIEEVVCSSKRDGMCFRCIFVSRTSHTLAFWRSVVAIVDDPFVNAFAQASSQCRGDGGLVIPASNGTAFLTFPAIQNWMACSMALSNGVQHDALLKIANAGGTALDVLLLGGTLARFVEDLCRVGGKKRPVEMHAFEAIGGPDRMCAFDAEPHTELASSYAVGQCGISYLGCSCSTEAGDLEWIPHFDIPGHAFQEPTFWRFADVTTTLVALKDLAKVFAGELSLEAFFAVHPRGNADATRAMLPDPEGFVAYMLLEGFGGVQLRAYCKAKTWMYYALHKIKVKNIPSILRMPVQFGEAFPSYKTVRDFFGNFTGIQALVAELRGAVMCDAMRAAIPTKAAAALARAPADIGFKMVLNNAAAVWPSVCLPIAARHFAAFDALLLPPSGDEVGSKAGEGGGYSGDSGVSKGAEERPAAAPVAPALSKRRTEAASILKGMLMELRCYEAGWEAVLAGELDMEKVAATGQISTAIGGLWGVIWAH